MHSLPIFVKLTGQPVILIGEGDAADAKRRLLERAGAQVVGSEAEARIAIVATEDAEQARSCVAQLRARGILVNATDRPDLCDFTLPAIVDRDPVLVAIGTGGASAGLAKTLRLLIEALLPPTIGALARGLHAARGAMRERWPDANERRQAIDAALAGPLDPLSGADDRNVTQWLTAGTTTPAPAFETILLRSADPDDLTLREARWLGRADRVVHQPDIPAAILDRARADAARQASAVPPAAGEPGFTLWLKWGA